MQLMPAAFEERKNQLSLQAADPWKREQEW
jgi:hypothetical protein